MSGFISVIILILVLLIQAFLRLSPNLFAIFLYSTIAKNTKKSQSKIARILFYILGALVATALPLIAAFYIAPFLLDSKIAIWIILGVFIAEAIASFCFYFKKGSTRLFISRRIAKALTSHAEKSKNRSDAFILGFISKLLELPFMVPLFFLTAFGIILTKDAPSYAIIILYLIITAIPLIITLIFFKTSNNLADFQRLQAKTRTLARTVISLGYLIIAVLILTLILRSSL